MVPDLPATTFRPFSHYFDITFLAYDLGRPDFTFIPYLQYMIRCGRNGRDAISFQGYPCVSSPIVDLDDWLYQVLGTNDWLMMIDWWWLIDDWLMIDWWLIDDGLMIDWLMIDWWWIDDWLIDWWLIDDGLMIDWLIDWWLIDGLIDDWWLMIDGLIVWLINWLIDWLIGW